MVAERSVNQRKFMVT